MATAHPSDTHGSSVVSRGRPRTTPGSTVCAWVTVHEHDRLVQIAQAQRTSVSAVVRQAIVLLEKSESRGSTSY